MPRKKFNFKGAGELCRRKKRSAEELHARAGGALHGWIRRLADELKDQYLFLADLLIYFCRDASLISELKGAVRVIFTVRC